MQTPPHTTTRGLLHSHLLSAGAVVCGREGEGQACRPGSRPTLASLCRSTLCWMVELVNPSPLGLETHDSRCWKICQRCVRLSPLSRHIAVYLSDERFIEHHWRARPGFHRELRSYQSALAPVRIRIPNTTATYVNLNPKP